MSASTVVLEIVDVASDGLLERHHLDLADRRQQGPVWHLQYGGKPAGPVPALPTSWLEPPRWPMLPLDLALMSELVVYNFFPSEWEALSGRGEWLRLICESEQMVVSHYVDFMKQHFSRLPGDRDLTWLAAQDNANGALDPRPVAVARD